MLHGKRSWIRCNCVPLQTSPKLNRDHSPWTAQRRRVTYFLHPGYPGKAVLLSLPALDDGGVDFDTALVACGLIAGNRWSDGSFSLDCRGAVSAERPDDGILREPEYFFQLPGPLEPPHIPSCRASHTGASPMTICHPLWQRWAADATASPRRKGLASQYCILSKYGDGLEVAHLLPTGEEE
ncbi:hypothetical protein PpBr36_07860 [Pyricularia pennisetigena]|uniref:hypothetical protein n=1 Tax=Pyricularia pennisetigena TaxID=1578925 RepID=UPI001150F604|nr:hypothetical protein PpBr36_07860 [Pyricularia pennisetigena]TLS25445.1 hypothetical protein PpBr36_07860 [Pyricularia pennisetigena]